MNTNRLCFFRIFVLMLVVSLAVAAWGTAQERQGGRGMGTGMAGMQGTTGTITEITADHLTIKAESGDFYKVSYSANTRFVKDRAPASVKDLKTGDVVIAGGQVDEKNKTVGAIFVAQLSAEQAKAMRERQASYGKTWVAGKIESVNETKITLTGFNNTKPVFVVDENTSFRKNGASATLADFQVGDSVYVQGTVRNAVFTATSMEARQGHRPMGAPEGPGSR